MEETNERQPEVQATPSPPEETESGPKTFQVRIRFGMALDRGVFNTTIPDLHVGETCIVRSRRGLEWGEVTEVLSESRPEHTEARVLRRPQASDLARIRELLEEGTEKEFLFCREKIAEHDLPMKLVAVEKLFSGDKIIFYFTANGRVDFRALVRTLAQAYRKRIELKQIGVRDEAKILGCVGHCGRVLCCRSFMQNIEQVTMKMAKVQKSTLDPTKISGRCGRLMCCLRFEDKAYIEMKAELPSRGAKIWTDKGEAVVMNLRILGQKLLVQGPGGDRFMISLSDVRSGPPPPKPPPPPPRERRDRPSLPSKRGPRPPGREDERGRKPAPTGGGRGSHRQRGRGRKRPPQEPGSTPERTQGPEKRQGPEKPRGPEKPPHPQSRPPSGQGGRRRPRQGRGQRRPPRPRRPGGPPPRQV